MNRKSRLVWAVSAIILLALALHLAVSVTRVISFTGDNKDTFIRNSNGKYWEPLGPNVQLAIDDLGTAGGTVWVGKDVNLSTPILLKNNVVVDFEYHIAKLTSDVSFAKAQACQFATVKNVRVQITDGHTAPVLHLYIPPGGQWADRVRYNTFENIFINNPSAWIENEGYSKHNHTGIHLENNGGSNFLYNTFRDIQMHGVKNGIWLEQAICNSGWGNGNYFENIWIDQFETMIWFDVPVCAPWAGAYNQNVFQNVKGESALYSVDGVKDVSHNGNHFDHVLVWDWWVVTNPNHDWSLRNDSTNTYICAHYLDDVLDNGIGTRYCDNPWV